MEGPVFVIILVSIICATILLKSWMNKHTSRIDEERFNRLARAFMQHKEKMQNRIQRIESILAELENTDNDDLRQIELSDSTDSLSNDLSQKDDKVRS